MSVNVPHFAAIYIEPLLRFSDLPIFKMAAVRRIRFLEVGNFNCQYPSTCQFLCRSNKPFLRLAFFLFSEIGPIQTAYVRHHTTFCAARSNFCRPPCWICFTRVGTTHKEYLMVFVPVQNLVGIAAVISITCHFYFTC